MIVLDPTDESRPARRELVARVPSLDGRVLGLLDISKPRGEVFLDRLAELGRAEGITVRRYAKPTYTKPMPPDLRAEIAAECDLVISALAD